MKLGERRTRGESERIFALVGIVCLWLWSGAARADVFYYQDADGVFHFTNVPTPDSRPFMTNGPLTDVDIPDSPRRGRTVIGAAAYDDIIEEYAERYEVEPALVKAVIRVESGFNRHAVSPRGARGLMQLMPRTARHWGVRNVYDPRENIRGGIRHLRMLMDRYRNRLTHVLAAYNAGVAPVERYRGIPPYPETRTYVSRVLRYRAQYLKEQRVERTLASRS